MEGNGSKVKEIVNSYGGNRDSLISILQDVQSEYQYLPEDALRHVAAQLQLPVIQVYGVATFFKAFSLEPKGKHIVNVCLGTACHVRSAPSIVDEFERQLGICRGETTKDMEFTLETLNCLGTCALGPVVVVDGKYYGEVTPGKVSKILNEYREAPRDTKHEELEIGS
ncbi:MAG: NADH-quinone oxidoreductase subunit NuoE [Planctomycetota bacterium]|nr:MAG: NADH-quinone oxidoreductase subunit NuoE [Planctomycetota bacterium]